MLLTNEDIENIRNRFLDVRRRGWKYFFEVTSGDIEHYEVPQSLDIWETMDSEHHKHCESVRLSIKNLSVDIAAAARISPLLAEADMQELRHNTRTMLASLYFRQYIHRGVYIHHDEGTVLGVDPPTHDEIPFQNATSAAKYFDQAAVKILDLIDLLLRSDGVELVRSDTASYRPNTAFIMMAIDDGKPELEDIKIAIKDVFEEFGITAVTANEIEHEDVITDRILSEIQTSEFLIADLTGERPNVYYEIGYAHALNKRVILVRKKGTQLHFDLAHRNCPAYSNTTSLKLLLRKRLEAITNKKPTGS